MGSCAGKKTEKKEENGGNQGDVNVNVPVRIGIQRTFA